MKTCWTGFPDQTSEMRMLVQNEAAQVSEPSCFQAVTLWSNVNRWNYLLRRQTNIWCHFKMTGVVTYCCEWWIHLGRGYSQIFGVQLTVPEIHLDVYTSHRTTWNHLTFYSSIHSFLWTEHSELTGCRTMSYPQMESTTSMRTASNAFDAPHWEPGFPWDRLV